MKIGSTHEMTPAATEPSVRGTRSAGQAAALAPASPVAGDHATVSAAGAQLGSLGAGDFDQAKVDAIRQAIRDGRFTVNPEAIADRLIADAAALLGPRSAH